jgi:hypothetical protein
VRGDGARRPYSRVLTTVTLTADTSAADGTNPAGTVQFEADGTDIGSAVAVNASGVATTTTSFVATGQMALTALFTPTSTSYLFSQGTFTETIYPAGTTAAGSEPVTLAAVTTGPANEFCVPIGLTF